MKRLALLSKAVQIVWQSAPGWTVIGLGLAIVQSLLPLASLYLIKLVVDAVAGGLNRAEGFGAIIPLLLLTGLVSLAGDICRSLATLIQETQNQAVTDFVYQQLHEKSASLDLEYYENAQYYDALHRAQSEATYRPTMILNRLVQTGQGVLSLSAITLLLISLNWFIPLILLVAVLPGGILRLKYAEQIYHRWREWTPRQRRADYFSVLLTNEAFAKEVRLFNLGGLFQERFRQLRRGLAGEKLELARKRAGLELATQFGVTLAVFCAWGFMAYQTYSGAITLGGLVMYYQAFQRGQSYLQETLSSVVALYEDSLFLANFYEFLDLKPKVPEPLYPRAVPQPFQEGISFEGVAFHYPGSERPVLEEVSFTIRAGETVALVGENGAGKTTLVKLMCRLYEPTAGKITLDGHNLGEFETAALRGQISVVFQDYAHYNLSARENIGFGQAEQIDQAEKIRQAARQAGADQLIERLPEGYATILGRHFEEGAELSVGEWQKIALARAFLRPAQLVILDEPTSALDVESEQEVIEQFRRLTAERTAILISHRLSTIRLADRILVLEKGRIIENGSHEELLALKGVYARLFEAQARAYRE